MGIPPSIYLMYNLHNDEISKDANNSDIIAYNVKELKETLL